MRETKKMPARAEPQPPQKTVSDWKFKVNSSSDDGELVSPPRSLFGTKSPSPPPPPRPKPSFPASLSWTTPVVPPLKRSPSPPKSAFPASTLSSTTSVVPPLKGSPSPSRDTPVTPLSSSPIPSNQARINALLRKSLHGELVDTQFSLFSTRSKRGGKVTKPHALFFNGEALAANSEYFSSLLSGKSPNDPALVELQDYHTYNEAISLNYYGYTSDSDLEEEEETGAEVQDDIKVKPHNFAAKGPQRIIPSRRIVITDTAFKTWEALLYYLYTGDIVFAPLRSQGVETVTSEGLHTPSPCSPKSMYRLACKMEHVALQEASLAAIQSSLTERNIVQELSSSLAARFPPVLEMEVEILFQHIATPTVMKDFQTLIKRIANTADLPHGADILIRLHERILRQHYSERIPSSPVSLSEKSCEMVDKPEAETLVEGSAFTFQGLGRPQPRVKDV